MEAQRRRAWYPSIAVVLAVTDVLLILLGTRVGFPNTETAVEIALDYAISFHGVVHGAAQEETET